MKCCYCGSELSNDDIKSELTCDICYELFEAEFEDREEQLWL
ncbi:hypothetical protein [uncultured Clostridium sp.]|nr:hypothetical protein [uncultured Clostridium sp.]